MESKIIKKRVVVASVMSTTRHDINPENASRYFLINADESKEQTRRIYEAQRGKYSLERQNYKAEAVPAIVRKHQAAQRLLVPRVIVNPLSHFMEFPDNLMRLRRDHERFLDLMAVVCFLRQYQKPVLRKDGTEYIECDLFDYEVTREIIVDGILLSTLDEIPAALRRFYDEFRDICRRRAGELALEATEVGLSQRDLRKDVDWIGRESIKKYLRQLVRMEYLSLKGGNRRGQRAVYCLSTDEPIDRVDISMIPPSEEVYERMKKAEAKSKSG